MKLSDFPTLELARLYSEQSYRQISSNEAEQFFRLAGQFKSLYLATTNDTVVEVFAGLPTTIGEITSAIINTMNKSSGTWSSSPDTHAGALNRKSAGFLVQHGILEQPVVDAFFAIGTEITRPFELTTQSQFNSAKGLYSSRVIEFVAGKDIVLTLNVKLDERIAATVWCINSGFEAINAGRNIHAKSINKYQIDMVGKKSGRYEVRLPLVDVDFSIELI
jgi:hypothetical protein